MLILRELLFNPNAKFTQLNIQGLSSDNFSYHVNSLLEQGLVSKRNLKYSLTTKGKEYANQMDTDVSIIEKQPKIAVLIVGIKDENGSKYLLLQERTKEPYFGYMGFITGKIRFGEKVEETARRELLEESGLDCSEFQIKRIVHNLVRMESTGELLEDKMFYIVTATNPTGQLLNTRNGINTWIKLSDFDKIEKKYYDEDNVLKFALEKENMDFAEETFFIKEF